MARRVPRAGAYPARRERGFVLALALLTLAIVAVIASYLSDRAMAQIELARARSEMVETYLGIADTQAELIYRLATTPLTFDGLGTEPENVRLDDRPYAGERGTFVSVQDARGLLNLLSSDDERLTRLLRVLDVPPLETQAMIDTLRDYMDADDLRRLAGAEAPEYAAAGLAPPRNGPLRTPLDLRNVIGWAERPELWGARDIESLTSTVRVNGINPNTAPVEVLLSVPGITREAAAILLELRKSRVLYLNELIHAGATDPAQLTFQVFPLPAESMRLTHWSAGQRWVMRYSVTLTPRDLDAPWRIDYAYRVARKEHEKATDDRPVPPLPARRSAPPSAVPDLLPPFVGR